MQKNRYALIMGGPLRATQTLQENFMQTFDMNKFDLFVSCDKTNYEEYKSCVLKIKEIFITPPVYKKEYKWFNYRNDDYGIRSFLQFNNISNCLKNIKDNYQYYIRIRNDVQFSNKFDLDIEKLNKKNIHCCHKIFQYGGDWSIDNFFNDQFFIFHKQLKKIVYEFPYNIMENINYEGISNEYMLNNYFNINKITIEKFYGIEYKKIYDDRLNIPSGEYNKNDMTGLINE